MTKFSLCALSLAVLPTERWSNHTYSKTQTILWPASLAMTLLCLTCYVTDIKRNIACVPGVVALSPAVCDSSSTSPWAGRKFRPGWPGAMNHHRGAQFGRWYTTALQAPLNRTHICAALQIKRFTLPIYPGFGLLHDMSGCHKVFDLIFKHRSLKMIHDFSFRRFA